MTAISNPLVCFVALRPKSTAMVMAGRSNPLVTFKQTIYWIYSLDALLQKYMKQTFFSS